jgi:hypothetical protein
MGIERVTLQKAVGIAKSMKKLDTLFVSFGCNVSAKASTDKIMAQQFPEKILQGESLCILVDPAMMSADPVVIDRLFADVGYMVYNKSLLTPLASDNVTYLISSDFAEDGNAAVKALVTLIKSLRGKALVYIGDFTVDYHAFSEYPKLVEALSPYHHVYWSYSAREVDYRPEPPTS